MSLAAMEQALKALNASMGRMDEYHYRATMEGRLENSPIDAITALEKAIAAERMRLAAPALNTDRLREVRFSEDLKRIRSSTSKGQVDPPAD